jgi:hypothetical protein
MVGMGLRMRFCFVMLPLLVACSGPATPVDTQADAADTQDVAADPSAGPPFAMDFTRQSSLFDAPFPSADLQRLDGTINLHGWGNPDHVQLIDQCLALITRDARGFSQTGAIYLRAGAEIDATTLPALATSITADASVFLLAVDADSPEYLKKRPIEVAFLPDGGPLGDKNLLAILPLQGAPLHAATTYAAVVTRKVKYLDGKAPAQPPAMLDALKSGYAPPGMTDEVGALYAAAWTALATLMPPAEIAALAVFRTDDRAAEMLTVYGDAAQHHPVTALASAPTLTDTFEKYCVFESKLDVPVYQSGTPPYTSEGGDWQFDAKGQPIFNHMETGRIWFSVPRQPLPTAGFPTVVFIGAGGGGERAFVDRGVAVSQGFTTAVVPGSGPAQEFARVGWAGVQIDGTLEGIRNTTHGNEDFLLFNVFNPAALRDNVRQSALEVRLVADALKNVQFDASACPGAGQFSVHAQHLAVMGHSMGASILPLTMSDKSPFMAAILSGAGGSYIMNVMDKLLPLAVKPIAEGLLGYDARGRSLTRHDPALTLFEWAVEASDSQIYGPRILTRQPRPHVLMLQGLVDHYILPSIANAFSLAAGLDLAGPALDAQSAELVALGQQSLATLLPLFGKAPLPFPVSGNAANGQVTAVVVQNMGDSIEDGHETNFQTERPKQLYRCYLADIAAGKVPVIRATSPDPTSTDPCW